jgi:DNA-binding CsgD family transcriptional regulator
MRLFSARVLAPLLRQVGGTSPLTEGSVRHLLSPAELAVTGLVVEGLTYAEIASALGKSVHTVGHQLASARRKTGSRNNMELARCAARIGRPDIARSAIAVPRLGGHAGGGDHCRGPRGGCDDKHDEWTYHQSGGLPPRLSRHLLDGGHG